MAFDKWELKNADKCKGACDAENDCNVIVKMYFRGKYQCHMFRSCSLQEEQRFHVTTYSKHAVPCPGNLYLGYKIQNINTKFIILLKF